MKIAHICPFYTPAICGVKQVVEELAKRQAIAGHEVHVYTSDWDKNKRVKIKEEVINGVHVHRCRHIIKIANFVTFFPGVFFKLLRQDFDVIHTHVFGHPHFVLASYAAKIKKIPHIHTTHCPWTDSFRSLPGKIGSFLSYNFFSKQALKSADEIIAITPWEINFIKKYGGEDRQIKILPNGMSELFSKKIKNNDFKKRNKINSKDKIVLFFGRLNITKSPEKFVEIAKIVLEKTKRKDIVFVIRGPDEGMKSKIKQMVKGERRILLLPETRDRIETAKTYQAADIYVLPSFREGLPLTLFEAMASGLPIVATPVNGVSYEIGDGKNGFLVKWGDNDRFAEKIILLLENNELRSEISKNNLKKAGQYDWDIIFKKTMGVYEGAMEK